MFLWISGFLFFFLPEAEWPCWACGALIILSCMARTAGFLVTDSKWLIVPPHASFCVYVATKAFLSSEALRCCFSNLIHFFPLKFHTPNPDCNHQPPVRWKASFGISSPLFQEEMFDPGLQRLLLLLSMACDESRYWQRSWAEAVLKPSETSHTGGQEGQASEDPP